MGIKRNKYVFRPGHQSIDLGGKFWVISFRESCDYDVGRFELVSNGDMDAIKAPLLFLDKESAEAWILEHKKNLVKWAKEKEGEEDDRIMWPGDYVFSVQPVTVGPRAIVFDKAD